MTTQPSRATAYLIVLIGIVLAFVAAVVPYFDAGYTLMTGVLLAGIMPYLVYGVAIPFMRGAPLTVSGLALIVVHAGLVWAQRLSSPVDYSDGWIYYGPVILAVVLLPLAIQAMREPYAEEIKLPAKNGEPSGEEENKKNNS